MMSYFLADFVADVNASLKHDPGPAGREGVRRGLEKLLAEPGFIEHIKSLDIADGAKVLHKDKDLGYLILAHATREGAGRHAPHNHGSSWAIYGQVTNHTDMTEWKRTEAGEGKTDLEVARAYRLTPGQAGIYQNGAIHSVENPSGTRIIRITGTDLDTIDRERFDPQTGEVSNLRRTA
jgi:hypothetical protein